MIYTLFNEISVIIEVSLSKFGINLRLFYNFQVNGIFEIIRRSMNITASCFAMLRNV